MKLAAHHLIKLVEATVDDLLRDIDPLEERYPDFTSTADLRRELEEVIDAAITDWLIEKKGE